MLGQNIFKGYRNIENTNEEKRGGNNMEISLTDTILLILVETLSSRP